MSEKKVSWEMQVIRDNDSNVQKKINQWKHKYSLKILSMHPCPHKDGFTVAYLHRTPK